jgi:methyl-accepting chemotaxis protein
MSVKDLSIGTRLIGGFAVVLVIMLVIAASGLFGMSEMDKSISQIHNENSVKVKHANAAFENLNNITWAMRVTPYTCGTDTLESMQKQIADSRTGYKAAMAELEKLETSSEGKALIAGIKSILGDAVEANNKVMELSKLGKAEEALELQKTKADPLTIKIKSGFESLLKYEEDLSNKKYKEAQAAYSTDKLIMISMAIAALLLSVVIALVLTKGITAPLNEAVSFATSVADGDLTARCHYVGKDEPGRMIAALNKMAENLTTLVTRITDVSGTVSAASTQLRSTAEQIATGTEEVACQTGTVATASEEMAATSGDIARNCLLAAETCTRVSDAAHASAAVVNESISSMKRIAEQVQNTAGNIDSLGTRSNQIGEIVGTIEDIADQTNLLALNAAIEAARAGEQGRGFAVVADEVRALAERTTKATREIGEMIKAIQSETKTAVSSMEDGVAEVRRGSSASEKSGEALEEILTQINEITMQVNQIATAAEEQTATTSEITQNIQQVTDVVQSTARGAEETSAAATELANQSATMQSLIRQFKLT